MTIEIEKLMDLAKTMSVLGNQKRALKDEYEQSLVHFYSGGSFKATRELISFIQTIRTISNSNEFVLLDDSGTPIKIEDVEKFLKDVVDLYIRASNTYLADYQTLRNNKTIESILDL